MHTLNSCMHACMHASLLQVAVHELGEIGVHTDVDTGQEFRLQAYLLDAGGGYTFWQVRGWTCRCILHRLICRGACGVSCNKGAC